MALAFLSKIFRLEKQAPGVQEARKYNFMAYRVYLTRGNIITALVLAAILYLIAPYRVIHHPPGVLVKSAPLQGPLFTSGIFFNFRGYRITPLAEYDILARVLAWHEYKHGKGSDFSPIDLVLGWGEMSDSAVLDHLNFHLSMRYYTFISDVPIDGKKLSNQAANTHMVPQTSKVERDLMALREGNIVRLKGYLVRIEGSDGYTWSSSLTRDDEGEGACELMFVQGVETL